MPPLPSDRPRALPALSFANGVEIVGTAGNDYITPNSPGGKPSTTTGDDTVRGLAGNDYIDGWLGDDRLDGGEGDDSLIAGEGSDTLYGGGGNDSLRLQVTVDPFEPDDDISRAFGGMGDDTIEAFEGFYPGGRGASGTFDGGAGDDRLVIWALQRADIDTRVLGGDGQDDLEVLIAAGPGKVVVDGGGGDDRLVVGPDPFPTWSGTGSRTEVYGGTGNDEIVIGVSNEKGSTLTVDAGDGDDVVEMSYVIDGGVGIGLGAGNDRIDFYFTNNIIINAGSGTDELRIDNSVDVVVNAGKGSDHIVLEATQASVTTGAGRDTVYVGSEAGTEAVRASTVTDFTAGKGGDRLDLDGVNELLGLPAGSDPFAGGRAGMQQGTEGAVLVVDLADPGDEPHWVALLTLKHVEVGSLTADNFVQPVSSPAQGLVGGDALSWQQMFDQAPGAELDFSGLGGSPAQPAAAHAAAPAPSATAADALAGLQLGWADHRPAAFTPDTTAW